MSDQLNLVEMFHGLTRDEAADLTGRIRRAVRFELETPHPSSEQIRARVLAVHANFTQERQQARGAGSSPHFIHTNIREMETL